MEITKLTGLPLGEGLKTSLDLPHTITFAVTYRARIDSMMELPEDKRPPRNLWDKPYQLKDYFDEIYDSKNKKQKDYVELDLEDVE